MLKVIQYTSKDLNSFSCTYLCKDFNPVEFIQVIRFAEFKEKLGDSHVLASLIVRAIEKFNFKRSQLEGCENSIFRTFLEVKKNRLPQIYLRLVIVQFRVAMTAELKK